MIYVDSNVFVYATAGEPHIKERATAALDAALREGAVTSALTCDEVVWTLRKRLGRDAGVERLEMLRRLPMRFIDVRIDDIDAAMELMRSRLDPRDAIHATLALQNGGRILSTDPDFDYVEGLRRVAI